MTQEESVSFSIGEAARRLGLSVSTVRYYDREGLLPDLGRSPAGRRRFTDKDLNALEMILCLKRSGLPLKSIHQYIAWLQEGDATLEERRALFTARRRDVRTQVEELTGVLDVIEYKCWYYERAVELGSEQAVLNLSSGRVPERMRALHARVAGREGREREHCAP